MNTNLLKLLNNKRISTLILHNNVSIDSETFCKYNVSIDCNGYAFTSEISNGDILTFKSGADLYNFILDNDYKPTKNNHITGIHLYGATLCNIEDFIIRGCNIPLCLHNTKAIMTGSIDISQNICGIYLYGSELTLYKANILNSTESYEHPTIVIDKDSTINGVDGFTMTKDDEYQRFYLNAKNALDVQEL